MKPCDICGGKFVVDNEYFTYIETPSSPTELMRISLGVTIVSERGFNRFAHLCRECLLNAITKLYEKAGKE